MAYRRYELFATHGYETNGLKLITTCHQLDTEFPDMPDHLKMRIYSVLVTFGGEVNVAISGSEVLTVDHLFAQCEERPELRGTHIIMNFDLSFKDKDIRHAIDKAGEFADRRIGEVQVNLGNWI